MISKGSSPSADGIRRHGGRALIPVEVICIRHIAGEKLLLRDALTADAVSDDGLPSRPSDLCCLSVSAVSLARTAG